MYAEGRHILPRLIFKSYNLLCQKGLYYLFLPVRGTASIVIPLHIALQLLVYFKHTAAISVLVFLMTLP